MKRDCQTIDSLKEHLEKELSGFEVHIFSKEKQEQRKKELEKELPISGDEEGIPKHKAWIVWIYDENKYISDLQVYELDKNLMDRWKNTVNYVDYRMQGIPYCDWGCVSSSWENASLNDVLFKFGCQYGFRDRNIMKKCMRRLGKIKEFEKEIKNFLNEE